MGRNVIETIMGVAVLFVAGMFLYLASNTAQVSKVTGYELTAHFFKVGGLSEGSDVRISGIKIGSVTDNRLDPKTFDAVVTMSIRADIKLPEDTVAAIASSGLLGGKYIQLVPGQKTTYLNAGGNITQTKDYRSLEDQVGEIIFLATGGNSQ